MASPDFRPRVTNWEDVRLALQQLWRQFQDAPYVPTTLFDANTIIKADTDNTPEALVVDEMEVVGRVTGGVIDGLTLQTTITDPGSDAKVATEQAIRELHESGVIASGKASWAEFFVMAGLP